MSSAPLVLAHAGHWFAALPFFGPVLAISGGLVALAVRDRRRGDRD